MAARRKINHLTVMDNIEYFSRNIRISTILRDQNIAKARDDGMKPYQIAKSAGLSVQRVTAILKRMDK